MKISLTLLFIVFTFGVYSQSAKTSKPLTESEKIDYLIQRIENLKDAKFYRNGSLYDAKSAAAHLKMKREKAGSSIKTVHDFIEKIASTSSTTNSDYKIVFNDGEEVLAKDFYLKCLRELE
jgi:hypothetical protein